MIVLHQAFLPVLLSLGLVFGTGCCPGADCVGVLSVAFEPPISEPGAYVLTLRGPDLIRCEFDIDFYLEPGECSVQGRFPNDPLAREMGMFTTELERGGYRLVLEADGEVIFEDDLRVDWDRIAAQDGVCGPVCWEGVSEVGLEPRG